VEKGGSDGKGKNKMKEQGMKVKKGTLLCNLRQTELWRGTTSCLMK